MDKKNIMDKDKIKGVLFDFDGVIGKSMEDNFSALKKSFSEYGVEIKEIDLFAREGGTAKEIIREICDDYGINPELWKEIFNKKEEYYKNDNSFMIYPGVEELIRCLKSKNIKLGIVSGGEAGRMKRTTPNELWNLFDVIITGNDVENGKPNPEPFLKCLKGLNLKPEECIVVENAPLGVKSAKGAGMFCIAITTTLTKEHLKEADIIINSHSELMDKFFC